MGRFRLRLKCFMIASATFYIGGIVFAAAGQQNLDPESRRLLILRVGKDNQGDLWDASFLQLPGDAKEVRSRVGDASPLEKIKKFASVQTTVEPSPETSERAIEETIADLHKAGIENINMLGPYCAYAGRIYYFGSTDKGITAPQLAVDREKLRQLAIAAGAREKIPPGSDGQKLLGYYLLVDETGKLVKIRQIPPAPLFPEIEEALAGTQVVAPGRRGQEPVRSVTMVIVNLK